MNKVRLVGGPGGGKVITKYRQYGPDEILVRFTKPMTRKRKMEILSDPNYYPMYYASAQGAPGSWKDIRVIDGMVEARYKRSVHPHFAQAPTSDFNEYGIMAYSLPCVHPDGSVFYEYVEGSRRDLT